MRSDDPAGRGEDGNSSPFDLRQRVPKGRGALGRGVDPGELVDEVSAARDGSADNNVFFEVRHARSVLGNFDKEAKGFSDFVGFGCGDASEEVEESVCGDAADLKRVHGGRFVQGAYWRQR